MNTDVRLKIKTLDNKVNVIECPTCISIAELKKRIEVPTGVPHDRQRLVFQGKMMEDSELLQTYKIENDFVIHLIAHSPSQELVVRTESSVEDLLLSTQSITNDLELLSGILRQIRQTTFNRQNLRRVIMQQRGAGFMFDRQTSMETIKQNYENIQQMMDCQVSVNDLRAEDIKNTITFVNPFRFQGRKLKIGQWIDLKDTIDQWLEAQVIDIANNRIFVHYNGWDQRWDEWIDIDSPRIAIFRTYTVGSASQDFMSPLPVNEPDGEGLNSVSQPLEMNEFVFDVGFLMNKMTAMLIEFGKYQNFKKLKEKQLQLIQQKNLIARLSPYSEESKEQFSLAEEIEKQDEIRTLALKSSLMSSQLGPLFDRMGRMMVDLAPHFAMMGTNTQTIEDNMNQRTHVFQVPVMLTPTELNQTQIQSHLLTSGNAFEHINTRIGHLRQYVERQGGQEQQQQTQPRQPSDEPN